MSDNGVVTYVKDVDGRISVTKPGPMDEPLRTTSNRCPVKVVLARWDAAFSTALPQEGDEPETGAETILWIAG